MDMGRSIHMYAALAQAIGKAIQDGVNLPVPHYSAFGAIKGRRRDEALGIHMINMYKAKSNILSCVTDLFDVRNAFYCVQHSGKTNEYHSEFLAKHHFEKLQEHCTKT